MSVKRLQEGPAAQRWRPGRGDRRTGGILGLLAVGAVVTSLAGESIPSYKTYFYSTAQPPRHFPGARPVTLALADLTPVPERADEPASPASRPPEPAAPKEAKTPPSAPARVASSTAGAARMPRPRKEPAETRTAPAPPPAATLDPLVMAKRAIAECQERYRNVRDYTCLFIKRERIDGEMLAPHQMIMKVRSNPASVYVKFVRPNAGREAIYVAGRHGNQVVAHDVGLGKLVAGTLYLHPRSSRAMEDNRHPITDAGIGQLIETVARHWAVELRPGLTEVTFHHNLKVANRPCTMIETTHPRRLNGLMFAKVKLYIDHELGLPVRFEAYDWPARPGGNPPLVEEYTYLNVRPNVGLTEADFDPANARYSFGRL